MTFGLRPDRSRGEPDRSESGNILVETAFALPLLVALLIGLVDLGLAVQHRLVLEGAARAGAQTALVGPSNAAAIEDAVRQSLGVDDTADDAGIATSVVLFCECSGAAAACDSTCDTGPGLVRMVAVDASRAHDMLLSYPVIGNRVTLTGRAVFRVP